MPEQRREVSAEPLAATVVVPTKNRAARVVRLLEALSRQARPGFEVVVVDDGSTDGTAAAVEARAAGLSMPVRVLRNAASEGPARARNRGWRAGAAPVVLFTDDDCVPGDGWVAALVDTLTRGGADLVAGPTAVPDDQRGLVSMWSHQMIDDGRSGHYSTCNVGYRREALEAVGGFDESFEYRSSGLRRSSVRGINGEDTDLAWRVIELGFRPGLAPEAVVFHDVSPQTWLQHARNMRRLEGIVLMFKKHPRLRREFGRRVVFRPAHVSALAVFAGLAGLSVPRVRPLALVGVAGVVWHTRVYRRYKPAPTNPGGYLVAVPLAIAADAYAALVMLRASARYRTLLL